jgi:hypothetical protein
MIKHSFLIYTHHRRFGNLAQTLMCLLANDAGVLKESEVVVVSQRGRPDQIRLAGLEFRTVDLGDAVFNKPAMVNRSVREAAGDRIVMLDGDRVLPAGYFGRVLGGLRPGDVVTTRPLFRLARPHSTPELLDGSVEKTPDHRDPGLEPGKKNLFSGNTVMFRTDFLAVGGMDESYVNYGCADLDMSTACVRAGLRAVYREDEEWHLWHPFDLPKERFVAVNALSAVRYCQKWGRPVPEFFRRALADRPDLCMMT